MNLKTYITGQSKTDTPKKTKLQFLKSISDLLLKPTHENFKTTIKHLSILAKTYTVPIKDYKPQKTAKNIDKELLYKTSEIIKNHKGYIHLLPEVFKLLVSFAKTNNIKLEF